MQLNEALEHVRALQSQVEHTERFCCYRAATIGLSGGIAMTGALAQSLWLPHPTYSLDLYLQLWVGVAALSVAVIGWEMYSRWNACPSAFRRQQTLIAIGQFAPCLIAGILLTYVIYRHGQEHVALLPGLWSVLFAMGIFGSLRQLPHAMLYVASYYLLAGCWTIALFRDEWSLSPLSMTLTFGIGQIFTAIVLRQHMGVQNGGS